MRGHSYTPAQINWLRKHRAALEISKLAKKFNALYKTDIGKAAISATLVRNNIRANRTGHYQSKNKPWNYGKKGLQLSPASQFKKGIIPVNIKPVGSERRRKDGYIWVKIADPRTWRQKHVLLWESVHGPRPPGHSVIFIDQNQDNIAIDNLELVSNKLLMRLNKNRYKKTPEPLKPTVMALSKLEIATNNWDRL